MADVSKLNLYGDVYNIKDATARQNAQDASSAAETAQQTASNAVQTANTAKTTVDGASKNATTALESATAALSGANIIEYQADSETINISKVEV